MTEPRPMQEIHAIQEEIYNEDKKLPPEKKLDALHQEVEDVIKKFNLHLPIQQHQAIGSKRSLQANHKGEVVSCEK